MIKLELRNTKYKCEELNTLKEAKERFPLLRYLDWLNDNDLGVVTYSSREDAWFTPIIRKGKQLSEVD